MKKLTMGLGVAAAVWLAALCTASAQDQADLAVVIAGSGGVMEPPMPEIRLVNAGAGIPVGGALLIYAAGDGSGLAPVVNIANVETPNTTLGGSLTMLAGTFYWVWIPTVPLTEGATYEVEVSSQNIGIGLTDTFEVVPAITIARPAISTAPSVSWRGESSQSKCCRMLIGTMLLETGGGCFPTVQVASIVLDPGFTTAAPAVLMNQFLFRMSVGGTPASLGSASLWPNFPNAPIYSQAEEYCFELEAVNITSGMVFPYEDLARCAPHGELADLDTTPIEPSAAELDRLVCHAPPEQFTEQWCELNEEPCADDAMATACGLYGHVCRDEPLPPDPFGGFAGMFAMGGFGGTSGGFGGAGGRAGVGGEGGIGATGGASAMAEGGVSGGGDDDNSSSGSNSGCSTVMARHTERGASALALWLGVTALALAARRRKSA